MDIKNIQLPRLLLLMGTSPNSTNLQNESPIFEAVRNGAVPYIILLKNAQANLNLQNNKGQTPLVVSILKKNEKIAKLLIKYGANPKIQDSEGVDAIQHDRNQQLGVFE